MSSARSRFSHRHLLALATFLVPLAICGGFVWNELQRSGASAQAAMHGAGRQFVKSTRDSIERRIQEVVEPMLEQSQALLAENDEIATTFELGQRPMLGSLTAIILLGPQSSVVSPQAARFDPNLIGIDEMPRGLEPDHELQMAEFAQKHGDYATAIAWLDALLASYQAAGERRFGDRIASVHLQLGVLARKLGHPQDARQHFVQVTRLQPRRDISQNLVAAYQIADIDGPDERLALLRDIATNKHWAFADGLLSAIAQRLAASFPPEDARRSAEARTLLAQDRCRVEVRAFAADFRAGINVWRRARQVRATAGEGGSDEVPGPEVFVWKNERGEALVCVRPATEAEQQHWQCTAVAFRLDLKELLGPWRSRSSANAYVLAVQDGFGVDIVPPPPATPPDFVVPSETLHDMTLSAYPADPADMIADAEAAARMRTLAMVALFVTALGGALWSWRSVNREAELAAMKVDLVSRVSHELKTPLALVRMYGETLSLGRARDPEQASEFGSIIAREAERLTSLIQRILDFSRQQAGTLRYESEPVDLTGLLRIVVEAYAPHLQSRGASLIDSLPHGVRVHCDPNACESAIVNLLENAAKYGREGDEDHEIELDLQSDGRFAIVEVRDRGRGIPAAEREAVFAGFYRASNSGEVRGAGLGLSLVRHFARAHGGDVVAVPRDGGGTILRLTLPLASAPASANAPNPTPPSPSVHPAADS